LDEDFSKITIAKPTATDVVPVQRPNPNPIFKEEREQVRLSIEQRKTSEREKVTEIILTGDVM
jgi:hypothetical protein